MPGPAPLYDKALPNHISEVVGRFTLSLSTAGPPSSVQPCPPDKAWFGFEHRLGVDTSSGKSSMTGLAQVGCLFVAFIEHIFVMQIF